MTKCAGQKGGDSNRCRSETDPTGLHGNAEFGAGDGRRADFRNDCDGGKSSGFRAIRQYMTAERAQGREALLRFFLVKPSVSFGSDSYHRSRSDFSSSIASP
ncbi:MAG: hypothetical protein DMF84_01635 [Acidobacteria bacterium]|nr:MAG: hypothetical protein DMF84_01635 [Acidobacteriota bacterium]